MSDKKLQFVPERPPKPAGRPKGFDEPVPNVERQARFVERLAVQGGRVVKFAATAEDEAHLRRIRIDGAHPSDSAAIRAALAGYKPRKKRAT